MIEGWLGGRLFRLLCLFVGLLIRSLDCWPVGFRALYVSVCISVNAHAHICVCRTMCLCVCVCMSASVCVQGSMS